MKKLLLILLCSVYSSAYADVMVQQKKPYKHIEEYGAQELIDATAKITGVVQVGKWIDETAISTPTAPALNHTEIFSRTPDNTLCQEFSNGSVSCFNTAASTAAASYLFVNVRDYGATGNGTTDDSGAINNACTANSAIFVQAGVYRISNSISLACYVNFSPGASFSIDSGKTVTFTGGLYGPTDLLFSGSGNTIISSYSASPVVYAEWWGALCNGSNDDALAIQKAVNAMTNGGKLQLLARPYFLKTPINVTTLTIAIEGVNNGLSPLDYGIGGNGYGGTRMIGTNGVNAVTATNVGYFKMSNIMLMLLSPATTPTVGLTFSGLFRPIVHDMSIIDFSTAIHSTATVDAFVDRSLLGSVNAVVSPSICFDDDTGNHLQNPSLYISHVVCGQSVSASTDTTYGFYVHGNRPNDLYMDQNESDGNTYGYFIDGSAGIDSGYGGDIHLRGNIADGNSAYGFYVNSMNSGAIVGISNGWSAGAPIGVYITSSQNIRVDGMELLGGTDAVYVAGSSNVVVSGNQMTSQSSNMVVLDQSQYNTVSHNTGYQVSNYGATFINLLSAANYNTIADNVGFSTVAGGFLYGVAAEVSPNGDFNSYSGNIFSVSGTTTPFSLNLGTNVHSTELDATNGLIVPTAAATSFNSRSSNIAAGGVVRLANGDAVNWRNAANSGDDSILVNASDEFVMTNPLAISPVANQIILGGTGGTNFDQITAPTPAADRTYTIPDIGSNGTFAFKETLYTYAMTAFTSTGTFTTSSNSSTSTIYKYIIVGAAGGGGGSNGTAAAAGGGGAGEFATGTFTGVAANTNLSIAVSTGGIAGSSSGTNGTAGFGVVGIGSPVSIYCNPGSGGFGTTSGSALGGSGGTGGSGSATLRIPGMRGFNGNGVGTVLDGGNGGSTQWGQGATGPRSGAGPIGAAVGYGAGGAGGSFTATPGSNGTGGLVIIERLTI